MPLAQTHTYGDYRDGWAAVESAPLFNGRTDLAAHLGLRENYETGSKRHGCDTPAWRPPATFLAR